MTKNSEKLLFLGNCTEKLMEVSKVLATKIISKTVFWRF